MTGHRSFRILCLNVCLLVLADHPIAPAKPIRSDSMVIGEAAITLGMPQAEVSEKLRKYEVQKPQAGAWWVYEKRGGLWRGLGAIEFGEGKVCSATRYWQSAGDKASDLMKTVIAAIQEQGDGLATISGKRNEAPDQSFAGVSLTFSKTNRTVTLIWGESPPPDSDRRMASTTVQETLGSCGDSPPPERRRP